MFNVYESKYYHATSRFIYNFILNTLSEAGRELLSVHGTKGICLRGTSGKVLRIMLYFRNYNIFGFFLSGYSVLSSDYLQRTKVLINTFTRPSPPPHAEFHVYFNIPY